MLFITLCPGMSGLLYSHLKKKVHGHFVERRGAGHKQKPTKLSALRHRFKEEWPTFLQNTVSD